MGDAVSSETALTIHNLQLAVDFALLHRTIVCVVGPDTSFRSQFWSLMPGLLPQGSVVSGHGALLPNRSIIMVIDADHTVPQDPFTLLLVGWDKAKDKAKAAAWRNKASRVLGTLHKEC